MENSLSVQAQAIDVDPKVFSAVEMQQQVQAIQQVMKAVMKSDSHYGKVPGCGDKLVLLKPGAEKIMMTFRIGIDPYVEDMSTQDCVRYRVRGRMFSILDGRTLGYGVGECSSDETKYKWRSAFNDAEFEATDPARRRVKQSKYGPTKQIRTEIADMANTVLKMAKKRAQIDGVLTVTAASDIFEQDLEDMETIPGQDQPGNGKPSVQQPKAKTEEAKPAENSKDTAKPKSKLSDKTLSQLTDMMDEMKWDKIKTKAKMELYESIGDEAAIESCAKEYENFIKGTK
jgi:hypothetical protein